MFTQNLFKLYKTIYLGDCSTSSYTTVKNITNTDDTIISAYTYASSNWGVPSLAWVFYSTVTTGYAAKKIASLYKLLTDTTAFYVRSSTTDTSFLKSGVILGDDNTAATVNDYYLKGNLITTFTATTGVSAKITSYGAELQGVYGITNIGTENISIGEICLIMETESGSSTVLDRTTLTSPLVIAPNEMKNLIYSIRLGGTNIPSGN